MNHSKHLEQWLRQEGKAVVAFSGGIDSTVLVIAASKALGGDMIAVTGDSPSLPSLDREFIVEFCREHGIKHAFIPTNEMQLEEYRKNPENRCYYCKGELFKTLLKFAHENNYRWVLDGTNMSDLTGHRPGYRAIKELDGVKTPYVELKIKKDDIRGLAKEMGLKSFAKPQSACLASRIPWGTRIEPDDLLIIDKAENLLRAMGFTQVRVRHHGDLARVQVTVNELAIVVEQRRRINAGLRELGYKFITLDLTCYGE